MYFYKDGFVIKLLMKAYMTLNKETNPNVLFQTTTLGIWMIPLSHPPPAKVWMVICLYFYKDGFSIK